MRVHVWKMHMYLTMCRVCDTMSVRESCLWYRLYQITSSRKDSRETVVVQGVVVVTSAWADYCM
jgi:hypothetical protein